MIGDRPESTGHEEQNVPLGFVHELSLLLRAWRQYWFDHRVVLERRERYLCCGLGALTYFFVLQFLQHTQYRPGTQLLLVLIQSWNFVAALFIYIVLPVLLFAAITGHSERPRGRVRLYLDGFLLPLVVTYVLRIVQ